MNPMKASLSSLVGYVVICLVLIGAWIGDAEAQVPTIRPGDAVTITVRGVPDQESGNISGVYKVDADGVLVGLPYLDQGSIRAAGLTEGQLAARIVAAYKNAKIYKQPTITALVDRPDQVRQITVGGEVNKQGRQPYSENMTIYDAVTNAGGAARFGTLRRVFLTREGQRTVFDLARNLEDRGIVLLPGDTVDVDKKGPFEP